jgi:hypothetical protein
MRIAIYAHIHCAYVRNLSAKDRGEHRQRESFLTRGIAAPHTSMTGNPSGAWPMSWIRS